jgi:hypothetical protein
MDPASTAAPAPPASSDRKWLKWIAIGCAGLLVLGVFGAVGIVTLVLGAVKRSDAYENAFDRVAAHPEAIARLGEPIEPGWLVSGSVNVSGPGGEASLAIPVAGPEGEGTVFVEATKQGGEWHYTTLTLAVEPDNERIDLLTLTGNGSGASVATEEEPIRAAATPSPAAATTSTPGRPEVGAPIFATSVEDLDAPSDRFAAGTSTVYAGFEFAGLEAEDEIAAFWYLEGEKVSEQRFAVGEAFPTGVPASGSLYVSLALEEGFPPGDYRVDVWLEGSRVTSGSFTVAG